MTRKTKRNNRTRRNNVNSRGGRVDSALVNVHILNSAVFVSGIRTLAMSPATFIQSAAIQDVYELYRFRRLRYRLHRNGSISSMQVAAYLPGVTDNAPSTPADLAVCQHAAILSSVATVPTGWMKVPRFALQSYGSWYKTVVGSPDAAQEVQGNIFLAGNTTDLCVLEVQGEIEFKNPCTTSATPAERGALECAQERTRLLKLLGLSVVPSQPNSTPTPG